MGAAQVAARATQAALSTLASSPLSPARRRRPPGTAAAAGAATAASGRRRRRRMAGQQQRRPERPGPGVSGVARSAASCCCCLRGAGRPGTLPPAATATCAHSRGGWLNFIAISILPKSRHGLPTRSVNREQKERKQSKAVRVCTPSAAKPHRRLPVLSTGAGELGPAGRLPGVALPGVSTSRVSWRLRGPAPPAPSSEGKEGSAARCWSLVHIGLMAGAQKGTSVCMRHCHRQRWALGRAWAGSGERGRWQF